MAGTAAVAERPVPRNPQPILGRRLKALRGTHVITFKNEQL